MIGLLRNALAEFVGTFIFVFAIIGAVNSGSDLTPLAIGFALMVMVFATGHISGAHLNPAVSLGAWIRGAISAVTFAVYAVTQLVAGVLAALLSFVIWPAAAEPVAGDAPFVMGEPWPRCYAAPVRPDPRRGPSSYRDAASGRYRSGSPAGW